MRSTMLSLLMVGGCGGDKDGAEGPPVTFVTFNAGLAEGFVFGTDSRTPHAASAIAGLDADVVCLQEVWTPAQVAAVDAEAAGAFDHRYWPDADQSDDATCIDGEVDGLLDCLSANCDTTCVDEVVDCVFDSCGASFLLLPKPCMRCAMANVGGEPTEVEQICENDPVEFAYGGSYGTGLLSRHPITSTELHTFVSTSNRRGVIHAVIDAPSGPLDVYCTHLTAVFNGIPYPRDGDVGTPEELWGAEQLIQVDELVDFMARSGGEAQILMGDLNTGPGLDGIRAEAPDGYQKLRDAGFSSPYAEDDGRCTFCNDNPLIAGPDDDDNRLIDHVMIKGVSGTPSSTRVLDDTISAESCAMDLSSSAVSDHYGVSVTVAP